MTETPYLRINDPNAETAIQKWWEDLETRRGDRAELRRCEYPDEVFHIPAFHALLSALKPLGKVDPGRLARVCGLLAHVRHADPSASFAVQLARPANGSDQPLVSETRFQRLLRVPNDDAVGLYTQLRRFVRHLGGQANITDLAAIAYDWGDYRKRRMALDYFGQAPLKA